MVVLAGPYKTVTTVLLGIAMAALALITLESIYRYIVSVVPYLSHSGIGLDTVFIVLTFIFVHFPAFFTLATTFLYLNGKQRSTLYDGFYLALIVIISKLTWTSPTLRQYF